MKTKTINGLIILIMLSLVCCTVILPAQAAQKPVAKLSVTPTSGYAPLTVTFGDQNTGGKALWKWWGFGDGIGSDSTANTVTHTYTKPGTYKVFLKVTNTAGSDTSKLTSIIVKEKIEKPPVSSNPANSNNFEKSSRKSGDIQWIVIHDIEGSYSSGINTFKDPKSKASAHYVISKNGEITQMVSDKDIAYHAGNYLYNKYSIGIELEGYADNCKFTKEQYVASAKLVKWLCKQYNIPSVHYSGLVAPANPTAGKGIIGHDQVPNPSNTKKGGGISGHHDPGNCWKWEDFMKILNTN